MAQISTELREYLLKEWRYNCHPKYRNYFDQWLENLTDWQVTCFTAWMHGQMSPWITQPLDWNKNLTIGEIFTEAVRLARLGDSTQCSTFIQRYVQYLLEMNPGLSTNQASSIVKEQLGFYAGWQGDLDLAELVWKTYDCTHPNWKR